MADAAPEDAIGALDAASEAQKGWKDHPPRERGEVLRRAYEEIEFLEGQLTCAGVG